MKTPGNNIGDEAALKGIIYGLRERIECNIDVTYSKNVDLKTVSSFIDHEFHDESFWFGKIKFIGFLLGILIGISKKNSVYESFKKADAIIIAPGGAGMSKFNLKSLYKNYLFSKVCKIKNKNIMYYGCGMGPFESKDKKLVKKLISSVDMVTCRDEDSIKLLEKLSPELIEKVYLTSDSALQYRNNRSIKSIPEKIIIAMTPIDLSFFFGEKAVTYNNIIVESYATLINWLFRCNRLSKVKFMVHVDSYNEKKIVNQIIDYFDEGIQFEKCFPNGYENAIEEYKMCDVCVGARHHAAIFSIKAGTPAICVAYEHKAIGFMRQCNLSEYVIDVCNLNPGKLLSLLHNLIINYEEIEKTIYEQMDLIEENSRKNTDFFLKMIKYVE